MRSLLTTVLTLGLLATASPAAATTTSDLQADPDHWAGTTVVVTGELVGDYGIQSAGVWTQVNDDPYAARPLLVEGELLGSNSGMGLLIPLDMFHQEEWGPPGRYLNRGPIVRVTAVFRHNDPGRQGATFLEATRVELVDPARALTDDDPGWPLAVGLLLLGAAVGIRALVERARRPSSG